RRPAAKTKPARVITKAPDKPATPPPTPEELAEIAARAGEARQNLITATRQYKDSLEKLSALYADEEKRAAELVGRRRQLFDLGVLARRELTGSEQQHEAAQKKTAGIVRQLDEADTLMAEAIVAEEMAEDAATQAARNAALPAAAPRSGLLMVRYTGVNGWSLTDADRVHTWFMNRFGRPLPVSAWGQSGTHDALGFDHRNSFDVALHPDTAEGQALTAWLRTQGIPFIGFRGSMAGSATGAHIHIGYPSHRLSGK
ncbi:MAG: hypothetical protein ACKV2V_23945, partial [Blastocatellia bacterium]